ncbi:TolC family protein [Marinilabilia rubra]|uniref:TolC family protein n=2 Tax=Marinilabilia rubra TaxID=2162893 RepID=A0A2U2B4K9_9BACT|nr:TolC family protein [Marinilabilia rubra]
MLKNTIYISLVTILLSGSGFAQTPLTLEKCRNEALANNKQIQSSGLQVKKAEASVKEAGTAYLPSIDGSGSAMYIPNLEELKQFGFDRESLELYQAQITAQQAIYAGGKVRLSNKMAQKGVEIAKNAQVKQNAEIILQTDKAYWNLVAMQEQKKVVDRYTEALDSLEEQLQASYDLGLIPKSEILQVRVKKNEAEVTAIEVKNAIRLLQMNLAQTIGRPLDEAIVASQEPILTQKKTRNKNNTSDEGAGNRPEIKILKNRVDLARMEKKLTRADYLPQIGAQVSYGYLEAPDISPGSWQLNAGASLSIPIIHWREKKHKTQKAEISQQMAKLELQNTRELVNLEISQTRLKLEESTEKIQLARRNLAEATESLSEVEISYNAGLNTITDLLNAQAAHQRARASLVQARSDYQIFKASWMKATGKLGVTN